MECQEENKPCDPIAEMPSNPGREAMQLGLVGRRRIGQTLWAIISLCFRAEFWPPFSPGNPETVEDSEAVVNQIAVVHDSLLRLGRCLQDRAHARKEFSLDLEAEVGQRLRVGVGRRGGLIYTRDQPCFEVSVKSATLEAEFHFTIDETCAYLFLDGYRLVLANLRA